MHYENIMSIRHRIPNFITFVIKVLVRAQTTTANASKHPIDQLQGGT
jgi:hypothetical protein